MQLQILPDQFIISYSPVWVAILLIGGLVLFFVGKWWREWLRNNHKHSFMPGVLFIVSFTLLIGGINFYVYKIVFNKEGVTVFNIRHFNQHLNWSEIARVDYLPHQQMKVTLDDSGEVQTMVINLSELDRESMNKVKILMAFKMKQNRPKK